MMMMMMMMMMTMMTMINDGERERKKRRREKKEREFIIRDEFSFLCVVRHSTTVTGGRGGRADIKK